MKTIIILLIAAGLGIAAMSNVSSRTTYGVSNQGLIDGAQTTELIPDRVAYSLMFQLVSSPENEIEKRHLNAYMAEIGFESDADSNALITAAAEYKRRAAAVDSKANAIKTQEGRSVSSRSSETQDSLRELRAEHDSITDDVITSLSSKMSKDGLVKLHSFINERVKRKIKLRSSSSSSL